MLEWRYGNSFDYQNSNMMNIDDFICDNRNSGNLGKSIEMGE